MMIEKIALKLYSILERIERKAQWNKYQALRGQFKAIGKSSEFFYMDYEVLNPENIEIGDNCGFGRFVRLCTYNNYANQKFYPKLKIGNQVTFGNEIHIGCIDNVSIGNGTLLASRIFITDHFHGSVNKSDILTPHLNGHCQANLFVSERMFGLGKAWLLCQVLPLVIMSSLVPMLW